MKRFWVGMLSALLLSGSSAMADDAQTNGVPKSEAPNGAATKSGEVETPGERVSEAPRSDSPGDSQRVLPLRAGDRRGGAPVWIGAMCVPADATLRAQLTLPDGVGLIVARVMPGSPADKAGLKMHDVVAAIDDRPAGDVAGLMLAVAQSGEQGLKFDIVRAGKQQTVTVVPAERPDGDIGIRPNTNLPVGTPTTDSQIREEQLRRLQAQVDQLRGRLPEADEQRLQEWVDRLRRGENQPIRLQLFGPGLVLQGHAQLPDGVNVVIVRNGNEPTRITVTRPGEKGPEKWEVTEHELDKLPADLRDTIQAMVKPAPQK